MAQNETTKTTAAPSLPGIPTFGAGFDPYAMWQKLMADSVARWQAFADQYAVIETSVSQHAQQAVTNWAQLAKDAIAYGTHLSAEARKLGADAAKKMSPGA